MAKNKKKGGADVLWSVLTGVSAVAFGAACVGTNLANASAQAVNIALKTSTNKTVGKDDSVKYFETGFDSVEDLEAHDKEIAEQLTGEGAVLLKNNGALPLAAGSKISTLSHSSVGIATCGTGSECTNISVAIVKDEKDGVLSVAVPPYRVDVQREADLIEDILRIYGYNNVEIPSRVRSTLSYAPKPDRNRLMNLAADYLSANGFTEIMSNSLTRAAYYEGLESYRAENCVRILNPLSADLSVMRQTLLFNMLEAVQLNANRRNGDLKLYEFGNCYFYDEAKRADENPLAAYSEEYRLAIAVTGIAVPASWNVQPQAASFFTLRAVAEKLLRRFGIDIYALKTETLQSDLFGEALTMALNGRELLQIGTVSRNIRRKLDVKQDVFYLEMNFEALVKSTKKHRIVAEELSKFPEVKRDLALLVDKQVTFSALRDVAFATERKLLKSVSLFDVYEGDKLPEGKKSYALSFILEDKTRTLDEKAIERAMQNLTAQFERQCGAHVRA